MKTEFERVDYWMFAGAGLMALGSFLPILHLPVIGYINYLGGVRTDGIAVLVLAAAIAGLIVFGYRKVAMLAAFAAFAIMISTLVRATSLYVEVSQKISSLPQDNPVMPGLPKLSMASVSYGIGWPPLFAGALIVVIAGLSGMRGSRLTRFGASTSAPDGRTFDPDEAVTRYMEQHKPITRGEHLTTPSGPTFGKRDRR